MVTNRHPHSQLIDAVGSAIVAEQFELTPQRLHMWRKRGIPQLRRIAFAKLAAERGVMAPPDFLEALAA